MRRRTAARILAFQALYQWEIRGEEFLHNLDEFLWPRAREPEVCDFARELIIGTVENVESIDSAIKTAAEHWDISRMAAVDRAILRMGAHQIMHRDDIPPKVAIDEALNLAKRYSTEKSSAFVNGILDSILKRSASSEKGE